MLGSQALPLLNQRVSCSTASQAAEARAEPLFLPCWNISCVGVSPKDYIHGGSGDRCRCDGVVDADDGRQALLTLSGMNTSAFGNAVELE